MSRCQVSRCHVPGVWCQVSSGVRYLVGVELGVLLPLGGVGVRRARVAQLLDVPVPEVVCDLM